MILRTALVLFVLVTLATGSWAAEFRKGATAQVKGNSIWFQDSTKLARWQRLKKSGNSIALASYQDEVLSRRDAWQFTNPVTVRILRHRSWANRVQVEMTAGRMLGTKWLLDADALER